MTEISDEKFHIIEDCPDLAEIVVTLDPITTGFVHDLQLVIQLSIDRAICVTKMVLRSKFGCLFAQSSLGPASNEMVDAEVNINLAGSLLQLLNAARRKLTMGFCLPKQMVRFGLDKRSIYDLV